MKKLFPALAVCFLVAACTGRKTPDVSKIKVDLQVQRFEQELFAMDTTNIDASLQSLYKKYPQFFPDFFFNILGLPNQPDSTAAVQAGIRSFISSYKSLKDASDTKFANMNALVKDIEGGLKYVKYYFPNYKVPGKVITFIGPINSYGNIITPEALGVGLQMYLGRDYFLYQTEAGQGMYPAFVSRRFEPEYIPVNCIKNIIDDMYPNASAGRPLVEQMVEAGKRLYLLDQLMPNTPDTIKSGYTERQLQGSLDNEANIWGFFLQSDLLYATDPGITKDYMNDGPKTPALGDASPGFIGQFVGWQIVKKWMGKNEKITLEELMATDPKKVFAEAKYKPK